ncbi:hypothetical protein [Vibrio crassostreae]|uniref:hypothetical protein n=1 Tax=Vibrio crassostreae TaxID=246167 RepID=UPI001B3174AF|nr:hypothetical protein [Vibrio crassostreae]
MKTTTFKVIGSEDTMVKGTFIHIEGKGGTVVFEKPIGNASEYKVDESGKIKDIPSFIAAFIRRIDIDCDFTSVKVGRKAPVDIVRTEAPEIVDVIRFGDCTESKFINKEEFLSTKVEVKTLTGEVIEMTLAEARDLNIRKTFEFTPNQRYGKSRFINAVLDKHVIPDSKISFVRKTLSDNQGRINDAIKGGLSRVYLVFNGSMAYQGLHTDKTFEKKPNTRDYYVITVTEYMI